MKPREPLLERRRQYLRTKIAEQRWRLSSQLSALQGPLHAFEVARGVGEEFRCHAPLLVVAACLGFTLMRGGLLSKTLHTVRLANKALRWWTIAQVGLQLLRRWRTSAA